MAGEQPPGRYGSARVLQGARRGAGRAAHAHRLEPRGPARSNNSLATAYVAHNYGRSGVGWPSEVSQITATEAMDFHKKYYVGSNIVVAVVGDVKAAQRRCRCWRSISAAFPPGRSPQDMTTVEPKQFAEKSVVDPATRPSPSISRAITARVIAIPTTRCMTRSATFLSNGRVSRLYRSLVRDQQIAAEAEGFSPFPGQQISRVSSHSWRFRCPGHTSRRCATRFTRRSRS